MGFFSKSDLSVRLKTDRLNKLSKTFDKFQEATKQIVEEVMKEEACLTAREAMVYTPPMNGNGGGNGDKKVAEKWGDKAVEGDILSVVSYENKALASAVGPNGSMNKFLNWKNDGKRPKKPGVIQKIFDDQNYRRAYRNATNLLKNNAKVQILQTAAAIKSAHEEARKLYRGRIRRNRGKTTGFDANIKLANAKQLKDYIKERQKRVGWMKSGWLDVIKTIGPARISGMPTNFGVKDLPQFITRHNNKMGLVNISMTSGVGGGSQIKITNKMGNAFNVAREAEVFNRVISARSGKMKKRMRYFINWNIKQFKKNKIAS